MTQALFLALIGFVFVTTVTPGPNNMMLLASGANFGFRRSLPHMLGIAVGCGVMVFLVGLGIAGLFQIWPPALTVLKLVSVAYMLWLAWKIAHSTTPEGRQAGAEPFTFLQAAGFQWVNPKAWVMALGAVTAYVTQPSAPVYLLVGAVFVVVALPSVAIWAALGQGLRKLLTRPAQLRAFNWTMAMLLVLSLWPVIRMEI